MFHYIKYFVREGFRNVKLNGFMSAASVLSMICCLLLTGVSYLVSENIKFALKSIEGQNSITVYLRSDISEREIKKVKEKILDTENISSCNFYPKEEAMKEYEGLLGKKVANFFRGEGNPLPDAFHISMFDLGKYDVAIEKLREIDGIDAISDRSEAAKKLSDLKNLVAVIGFWVTVSFAVVSLLIISNTIRITLHNRRFEISIMKSIGATDAFVRAPFIIEGIVIGMLSAGFSMLILDLLYGEIIYIINGIAPFVAVPFERFSMNILVFFVFAGIFFGLLGGLISIRRYLRKEGGEVATW
jgi:cell division transport system permease protein